MTEKNAPQNLTYYSRVHDLCFYVLGDAENLIESNVTVTNSEIMRADNPMPEGIYDPHLGTTDYNWICTTCGNKKSVCPGHYGIMPLNYPVKSPIFRDDILKWLKIICHACGKPVIEIKTRIKPIKRLNEMVKLVKSQDRKCAHCNSPHPNVEKDKKKPIVFNRVEMKDDIVRRTQFYNHEIKDVLEKISDETVIALGKPICSHPKKFITQYVKVSPNVIRPDIRRANGPRSSNSDTTTLLKTISDINKHLPEEIPPPGQITQDNDINYINLDMVNYAMIKGGGGGEMKLSTNTNKPPVAIVEHWPKKHGRVRKNLMGKRVEYMIRSVITGDSKLRIDEVGIPINHARNLEIPETVTHANKDRLMIYFMNKKDRYPGCKRIIKKSDGHTYRIELLNKDYQLQTGDIIMRDMIDGDYICFNRQPSLLFSNISGMRIVVLTEGETLRINPVICNYFNADFDGDQMSAIVPQNIQARNECMILSNCIRWMISVQKQAPLVGAFQDGLIGLAEITKDGLYFNKWHAMKMLSDVVCHDGSVSYDFTLPRNELYTNRSIVSRLLRHITVINREPSCYKANYAPFIKYNPKDIRVNIIRGQLISGILDKANAGQDVAGSIFHIMANEYGNGYAMESIYLLQQLVNTFFLHHGFTVGIKDININLDAMREIKRRVEMMILESRKITERANNGKLIAPIGMSLKDFYELEQLSVLSPGDDFIEPILAAIDFNTNMLTRLIMMGSKGKFANMNSLDGSIGSQTINGRRFGAQAGWGRTSPYFTRYDTEPEANGFIVNSFREGIPSLVYAFAAGEARHGMISNALSTSITGYQNRISIKNLESIIVDNLRKSAKGMNVVQVLYAESGVNPAKNEKVKFSFVMMSDAEFEKKYKHTDAQAARKAARKSESKAESKINHGDDSLRALYDEEYAQLLHDREEYRRIYMTIEKHNPKEYIMSDTKNLPINVAHIIDTEIYNYESVFDKQNANQNSNANQNANQSANQSAGQNALDKERAVLLTRDLCATLGYVFLNDLQRKLKKKIPAYITASTKLVQILIRSHLCLNNLIAKGVSDALLDIIIRRIIATYKQSLISYGSAVGIIAAQCVSEPMTQYVLDSKHRAGGGGGTKTNAIVRIQEILGAKDTKTMKNPRMLIMVRPEYEYDKLKVQEIANHIEAMEFNRFVSATRIFYETYGEPVHPKYAHEAKIMAEIGKHNFGRAIPSDLAKWCVRFTLNKEELILKSMKLETIVIAIKYQFPDVFLVYTPENAEEVFLRCYMRGSSFKQTNNFYEDVVLQLANEIKRVIVRGVSGIISTSVIDVIRHKKNAAGGLETEKVFAVATTGSNLSAILSNEYIDPYRTQSDSVEEIEKIFGLVAAQHKISNEMMAALDGLSRIHCSVFASEMCFAGNVTSIQKTGLQRRENANITLRLSFQHSVQVITQAAVAGLCDRIGGNSGSLVMGESFQSGSIFNQTLRNEEFIKEHMRTIENVIEDL